MEAGVLNETRPGGVGSGAEAGVINGTNDGDLNGSTRHQQQQQSGNPLPVSSSIRIDENSVVCFAAALPLVVVLFELLVLA